MQFTLKNSRCVQNVLDFIFSAKSNATWANYFGWRATPLFLCIRENISHRKRASVLAVTPGVQVFSVRSSNFRFLRDNASCFVKSTGIIKLNRPGRFSKSLTMMSWARRRSRSGITARNITTLPWRVRHAQVYYRQTKTRGQLRRFIKYSCKYLRNFSWTRNKIRISASPLGIGQYIHNSTRYKTRLYETQSPLAMTLGFLVSVQYGIPYL